MKRKDGIKYWKSSIGDGRWSWNYAGPSGLRLAEAPHFYATKSGAKRGFMSFVRHVLRTGHPGALREREG